MSGPQAGGDRALSRRTVKYAVDGVRFLAIVCVQVCKEGKTVGGGCQDFRRERARCGLGREVVASVSG